MILPENLIKSINVLAITGVIAFAAMALGVAVFWFAIIMYVTGVF